jgi:AcrR family transcriptional regulator
MPRAGLTRDRVVDAAARVADAEGLDAVTVARVAAELGVRPPSLYNHVGGREGLRRELARRGLDELATALARAAIGRAREDALVALAHAYRAYALDHPGLYAATVRAYPDDAELAAAGGRSVDIVLAVLAGYGFEDGEAIHGARSLRSALHGFVSIERAGGFGLPTSRDESFARMVDLLATGLAAANRTG